MKRNYFFVSGIIILLLAFSSISCSKDAKDCPLQDYTIECQEKTFDLVFGGYLTGIQRSTIRANCPEDAQRIANDMSYDFGNLYQHCKVVP